MKRIYLKPTIKTVRMCPHTVIATSTPPTGYTYNLGDDDEDETLNNGTSSDTPSRWFGDDIWE